jgi:DNA polymerase
MLVGEQPGDEEDLAGKPFVGPAGRLLDELLAEAEIVRDNVYVTNAVKHFKWTPRGKKRLHGKPNSREITACRPWLDAELEAIEPLAVVCLGATAAQALLGSAFRVTRQRGQVLDFPGNGARWIMATYHPAAVLRAPDRQRRHEMRREMQSDLQKIAKHLARA